MLLSTYYGVNLVTRKAVLIFDEVQMFPQARAAIKYLVADGRYDYIETGSLISIKENVKDKSGKKYTTTSLNRFREKYKTRIGESYIIHPRNLIIKDNIVCIPAYMTFCL